MDSNNTCPIAGWETAPVKDLGVILLALDYLELAPGKTEPSRHEKTFVIPGHLADELARSILEQSRKVKEHTDQQARGPKQ